MKVYQTKEIKNIALVGGAKSGKTTIAEAMLFEGGLIKRRGTIEDKTTVSDYRAIELERQNSISSTLLYIEHNGYKINIIDAPGFDDFIGEVAAALKVADTAIMVINAQSGIDVGTDLAWRYSAQNGNSVIFAINHLEHENSNFDEMIRQLKQTYGKNVTICQYPVNPGLGFNAVIDLMKMKMLKFPENGGTAEELDIPAAEMDKAEELHGILVENAAEADESLMEIFFDKGTLTIEELRQGIKAGITNRGLFPVMCVAGKHNMGVQRLLEFITYNAPSPNDIKNVKTVSGKTLEYKTTDPATLFIFKTGIEEHLGEISFFKIYAGEVTEGMDIVNSANGSKERISQIFSIAGKNREKLPKAVAGDIVATIKLKSCFTNNTLNSGKNADDSIIPIVFPDPKFRTAIKAKNQADDEKLGAILNEMHKVDQTITVEYSKELKQIILSGQGELHLNIAKWHLETINKIEIEFIAPKIPYRETITKPAKTMYRHKKQSGGAGQFGEVHIMIQPYTEGMSNQTEFPIRATTEEKLLWGGKLIFNNCIVGGAIDARFLPAILKGIMEKMEEGPLTGSYARDIVVNVYDGKMHPVDSNELSFKLAGRQAFREAFKLAGPKILEPIYDVEVIVPSERMGDVMTDLQGRRAVVMGMDSEGTYQIIKAKVPLAEMNKYSTALSSLTSGRATYSLKYADYQQVPTDVQNALLKAYEEQEKDEE
ncbi:MAG: elongation factor G [Bacteroidetes bacterium]|nr:elongation factor G [Bacteroidota bacterium]